MLLISLGLALLALISVLIAFTPSPRLPDAARFELTLTLPVESVNRQTYPDGLDLLTLWPRRNAVEFGVIATRVARGGEVPSVVLAAESIRCWDMASVGTDEPRAWTVARNDSYDENGCAGRAVVLQLSPQVLDEREASAVWRSPLVDLEAVPTPRILAESEAVPSIRSSISAQPYSGYGQVVGPLVSVELDRGETWRTDGCESVEVVGIGASEWECTPRAMSASRDGVPFVRALLPGAAFAFEQPNRQLRDGALLLFAGVVGGLSAQGIAHVLAAVVTPRARRVPFS